MCLESRNRLFGVESIELWSNECTNIKFAKFEKSVSKKMYSTCKLPYKFNFYLKFYGLNLDNSNF